MRWTCSVSRLGRKGVSIGSMRNSSIMRSTVSSELPSLTTMISFRVYLSIAIDRTDSAMPAASL